MKFNNIPFSDLLSKIIDNRGKTCPTSEGGIPLIATNCIRNDLLFPAYDKVRYVSKDTYDSWFRGHPRPGDMVFVTKGSPGRVCWVPDPIDFCIAQDMVAIRADESKVNPKYLFALLRSDSAQFKIENMHVGTLIPHFKKGDFDKLILPIPEDLDYQKEVGDIYFDFCDKIELNRQINQTLEQIAQTLFKSWFVDFEPVKAKIAAKALGRDPERAAMCAISGKLEPELDQLPPEQRQQLAATAALFPDELVESELGLIPVGWEVQRLENIMELSYGKSLTKTDRKVGDFPVYGSGGITGCHNKPLVSGPGVIVGRKGTVGTLYWEDRDFFAIDTVFYVVPKGSATLDFLFYLLQTLGLESMNTDAAVPGLNRNNVYRLSVPMYPNVLMEAYSGTIGAVREKIYCGLLEIESLSTLRDSLLPKLLSGEFDFPEVIK